MTAHAIPKYPDKFLDISVDIYCEEEKVRHIIECYEWGGRFISGIV